MERLATLIKLKGFNLFSSKAKLSKFSCEIGFISAIAVGFSQRITKIVILALAKISRCHSLLTFHQIPAVLTHKFINLIGK